MLRYSIRIDNDEMKQEEVVWREKYLAPDLSFVTGVTSQDYHLEKQNKIAASNAISYSTNSILRIESENVTRQGFIVIKDKKYEIESGTSYSTVFLNGKYYYLQDDMFLIDNWLQKKTSLEAVEKEYIASGDSIVNDTLYLDTLVWIEDGNVVIDGETYQYDFALDRLLRNGNIVDASAITFSKNNVIEYYPCFDANKYDHITKFTLWKDDNTNEKFERISFISNYYYILYKNNYISVVKTSSNTFKCDVPKTLLNGGSGTSSFTVYRDYIDDSGNTYSEIVSGDSFDVLSYDESYVTIENNKIYVDSDILNANSGNKIGIYLENDRAKIEANDIIQLADYGGNTSYYVSEDNGREFILYKGNRYDVKPNLCDKVEIEGDEYSIKYLDGHDCVIDINGEFIPMTVINNGYQLEQKGLVVVSSSNAATMTYDVNHYSGITIDGVNYPIIVSNDVKYAELSEPNEYMFFVSYVNGSSLLICKPYLSYGEFSEEFIEKASQDICKYAVENQRNINVYVKNNIFGKREITRNLGYDFYSGATSTNNYFNLFDNFSLYTANAKIQIPLMLSSPRGSNMLKDDTIKRDFYEREKSKAMNGIIDMEKDVYYPKYFDSSTTYSGSDTDFHDIREIRFNLHFRTRNLYSWKVNQEHTNVAASADGLTNWFMTDFYPYKQVLSSNTKAKNDMLLNSSDIVGLLNFTNDDVYFQKSKLAKSFLRLSFYDNTDEQTQTLLAMSTVFMDEHKLYKRYIDNSRKGVYKEQFLLTEDVFDNTANTMNKVSTRSEFLEKAKMPTTPIVDRVSTMDEHRLGSEFVINSKYEAETSSEGYYLYMFKEYSENLVPKPIYMKVEFNHAGIGRTIPFIVPMKLGQYENGEYSATTVTDEDGYRVPVSPLTFNGNDLDELKKGIKLENVQAQSYIPLYAMYDFKNKQYAYVFDNRYVHIGEDNRLIINMFEPKYEYDEETSEDIQKQITYGRQPTMYIDMNKDMFNEVDKTCPTH